MKFFLDTANLDEIRQAAALGLADGVTTNPTLIAKEGNPDFKKHIAEICKIVSGPVSAETTSDDRDEMLKQGREYVKIAPNVVIKGPLTTAGLEATRIFDQEGIKVNVTLASQRLRQLRGESRASLHQSVLFRLDDMATTVYGCLRKSSRFTSSTIGRPRCWRPVCVTPSTSLRRRAWARTSRRCLLKSSSSC